MVEPAGELSVTLSPNRSAAGGSLPDGGGIAELSVSRSEAARGDWVLSVAFEAAVGAITPPSICSRTLVALFAFGLACSSPGWERAHWQLSSSVGHTASFFRTLRQSLQDIVPVVAVPLTRLMLDESQYLQRVICVIESCGCSGRGSSSWNRSTRVCALQLALENLRYRRAVTEEGCARNRGLVDDALLYK